jgi:phosphoglycerate dehydrogenase-like enzyme
MSRTRVVYTDPAWALNGAGTVDPGLATIEEAVYGEGVELGLGVCHEGRFITDGTRLHEYVEGVHAMVVYRTQVTPELLAAAGGGCRVIARQGVGLDNLNAPLLREAGIWGFHVPDYCGDEVSTHAVALALALERGVVVQHILVKANRWNIHAGRIPRRTCDLTAGIVGYGRIGRATSRKLHSIYGRVMAYDPYVSTDLMASYGVRKCEGLHELMAASQVVLLHAELTEETEGIIDADALEHAAPGALLVNTARGKLVDASAALAALEDGRLGGFASDVFSPEDPNSHEDTRRLLERDDVIVSSHRAFLSDESERSLRRRVADGVAHVLREGSPPPLGRVA